MNGAIVIVIIRCISSIVIHIDFILPEWIKIYRLLQISYYFYRRALESEINQNNLLIEGFKGLSPCQYYGNLDFFTHLGHFLQKVQKFDRYLKN